MIVLGLGLSHLIYFLFNRLFLCFPLINQLNQSSLDILNPREIELAIAVSLRPGNHSAILNTNTSTGLFLSTQGIIT